jgi:hypothetical protein
MACAMVLSAQLLCCPFVAAQSGARAAPSSAGAAGGPAWASLTASQQTALAPLKRDWSDIDARSKQKWVELAARFPAMPDEERKRVQDRMTDWSRLTPEERGRARLQFQEARQISAQDKQARWDAYMALPADQRQALASRSSTLAATPKPAAPQPSNKGSGAISPAGQKANLVGTAADNAAPKAVAPMLVQAKPGASTTLISKTTTPPPPDMVGQPKISATPGLVNRSTLLPQTGPQSAGAHGATAASGVQARQ